MSHDGDELLVLAGIVSRRTDRTFNPGNLVAFDCETTGLHAWIGDRPFAVSMCNEEGETWYCEWDVDPFTREICPRRDEVEYIRSILEDPNIVKVGHNIKFDIRMLEVAFGIRTLGRIQETLFAARACNSLEPNYTLKFLADKYLGVGREDADELQAAARRLRPRGKALGYTLANEVYADYWLPRHFDPADTLCQQYAELDAVRTLFLWKMYATALDQVDVRPLYESEMELWYPTYDMETRGVRINLEAVKEEDARHTRTIAEARKKMTELAWESLNKGRDAIMLAADSYNDLLKLDAIEKQLTVTKSVRKQKVARKKTKDEFVLNPNSTSQLIAVCHARGLSPMERTKSGDLSMSFNSIRTIADDEFIHELQRFRASQKVKRTFLEKYILHAVADPLNPGGICLHPMFNQAAAQTGRYGCSHPNLQQVVNANGARNAIEAMSARMAFGPRPGYCWYHFDYSQLELYLFASAAQEKFMLDHMMSGHDLHAECANKAWGGRGNPAALIKGAVALEVEAERPTTEDVRRIWVKYGWDPHKLYGNVPAYLCREAKDEFTAWWLTEYGGEDWNIVKAEKALGKKVARTRAKFVMYAKIYGGGWRAINNFLYCGEQAAREFQKDYDTQFPGIKRFIEKLAKIAEREGYITNPYGRKVGIPEGYYYKATNFLIQSTAADLLKDSMRKTYRFLKESGDIGHLLLTIHDELVFEWPLVGPQPTLEEKTVGDKTERSYKFREPSALLVDLLTIKDLMEDHEGRLSTPIPVECVRCDSRWDVKIPVEL